MVTLILGNSHITKAIPSSRRPSNCASRLREDGGTHRIAVLTIAMVGQRALRAKAEISRSTLGPLCFGPQSLRIQGFELRSPKFHQQH